MINSWGKHLILDLKACRPSSIRCKGHIGWFAKTLVNNIGMVPFGDPQVVLFGSGNKKGYTLVQLIETSNITGHFCEETNEAYIDIFSCKDFQQKEVEDVVHSFFEPEHIRARTFFRGEAHKDREAQLF